MHTRFLIVALTALCLGALVLAEDQTEPIPNWTAPPSWTPPATHRAGPALRPATGSLAKNVPVKADSLTPSPKYPFTPITPCRLVDTRQSPDTPYLDNGGAGETRTYHFNSVIPYTGTGACSLIPLAPALSLSVQFQVTDHQASLIGYPDDVTRPLVASVVAYNTGLFYMNSAIVPTGADGGINVFAQWGGQVVININGYYAPLLPYSGLASSAALTDLFRIENTGGGRAMHAVAVSDTALWAQSTSGSGVDGRSDSGVGVFGGSTSAQGVWGTSSSGDAVEGDASASGKSGVLGTTSIGGGYGVYGKNNGNSAYGYLGGVVGAYGNGGNAGVMGESTGGKGVHGKSTGFDGVWGESGASGKSGVYGFNSDTNGFGVTGRNDANSTYGYLGGTNGVYGSAPAYYAAVVGENAATIGESDGVYGGTASSDFMAAGVVGASTNATSNGGIFYNNGALAEADLATSVGGDVYGLWTGQDIRTVGTVFGGTKNFIAPHPEDPSKEIVYTSVEAPTADVYFRGTARLVNGIARIEVPDHFRLTAREGSYMATVTALAPRADLWVEQQDEHGVVVRGGDDVAFNYVVWAERDLYRNQAVVRENVDFTPSALGRGNALRTLPERVKAVLVKNGTLNADGTYNRETAERLNWTIPEAPTRWLR